MTRSLRSSLLASLTTTALIAINRSPSTSLSPTTFQLSVVLHQLLLARFLKQETLTTARTIQAYRSSAALCLQPMLIPMRFLHGPWMAPISTVTPQAPMAPCLSLPMGTGPTLSTTHLTQHSNLKKASLNPTPSLRASPTSTVHPLSKSSRFRSAAPTIHL